MVPCRQRNFIVKTGESTGCSLRVLANDARGGPPDASKRTVVRDVFRSIYPDHPSWDADRDRERGNIVQDDCIRPY